MTFSDVLRAGGPGGPQVPWHPHDGSDISGELVATSLTPEAIIGLEAGLGIIVAASDTPDAQRRLAAYKCDGTDDHLEIQEAIDEANANGGGVVTLLPGTYIIPELGPSYAIDVKAGVTLRGFGRRTILKPPTPRTGQWNVITFGGADVVIESLKIDGRGSGSTYSDNGINIESTASHATVRLVEIQGLQDAGTGAAIDIGGSGSVYALIERCYIHDTGQGIGSANGINGSGHTIRQNLIQGINLGITGNGIAIHSTQTICADNLINNTDGDGIFVQSLSGSDTTTLARNVIFDAGGDGIRTDMENVHVIGNYIAKAEHHGIQSAHEGTVHDNYVLSCGQAADNTYAGIYVNGARNSIQGNYVRHDNLANQHAYGIEVRGSLTREDNLIANNDLLDAGRTAAIQDGGIDTRIYGNRGHNDWQTYTPELQASTTNPTLGTGAVQRGKYKIEDGLVHLLVYIQFGSGSSPGSGEYRVTLPVAAKNRNGTSFQSGAGNAFDWSVAGSRKMFTVDIKEGNSHCTMLNYDSGTFFDNNPWVWDDDDRFSFHAIYEA